jgi:PAS domain S-box-containing protein
MFARSEPRVGATPASVDAASTATPAWAGLAEVVLGQMEDAFVVSGADDRISVFNPAAERQYGIPAGRALGRTFADMVDVTTLDGSALGYAPYEAVAESGSWQGRVLHRPRVGSLAGTTLIVEVRLSALRDEHGVAVGIIGVNRDVTASARLEAEMDTLGALAAATGRARSPREIAETALDRLCVATGAGSAMLVSHEGGTHAVDASRNVPSAVLDRIRATKRADCPLEPLLRPGAVLTFRDGPDHEASAEARAFVRGDAGGTTMVATLAVRGEITGCLALGWTAHTLALPSEAVLLQAASHLAVALDGARLTERLATSLDQERRLTAQLETMVGLTQLPEEPSVEALSRFVLERLIGALGSVGGFVCVPANDRLRVVAEAGESTAFTAVLQDLARDDVVVWQALAGGLPVYSRPFEPGTVHPRALEVARRAGHTAVVAFPIRDDGTLVGAVVTHFSGLSGQVVPDEHTLEAIARVVSIAFSNARLGRRLSGALAAERRLASELQTLQELTRLGAASDDIVALARETMLRLVGATHADGGTYALVDRDHNRIVPVWSTGVRPHLDAWLNAEPASNRASFQRFEGGGGAYVRRYDDAHPTARALGRLDGLKVYATLPLRVAGAYVGQIYLDWLDEPDPAEISARFLDSTAHIASISLANFRLREQLMASEERYRTLFAESPDALELQDVSGSLLDLNEAATRLYGGPADELVGLAAEARADIDAGELERRIRRVTADGRATFRGVGVRRDGTRFPEEVAMRLVDIGGQLRILTLVRDLTDQERLQSELLQAQKMESLGQLVSGVAHELNNPLAAVIAFSQLLRDDPRLPGDMRHDSDLLVQEADRTRRIVQNLLDFARQRPPERRPTSIRALVQSVLELQAYALRTAHVETSVEIADGLPLVAVDRAQLQQVLLNLTTNAIQAIHGAAPDGRILIHAAVVPGEDGHRAMRVTVTDDGPGVPPGVRERLFDPFFTTKEPGEGTGLGLSVSFGIAASHGGRLWHEQGPRGIGSSFVLELPLEPVDAPSAGRTLDISSGSTWPALGSMAPRPGVAAATTRRRAVLVLDDEPSIRAFLGRVLGGDLDVVEADCGSVALERIRERPFDVVLIDHRMAGMDGTEFYDAAIAIRPELSGRAVFMSGDVLNPDLRGFAAEHGVLLLAKPFDNREIGGVVREVLDRGPAPS